MPCLIESEANDNDNYNKDKDKDIRNNNNNNYSTSCAVSNWCLFHCDGCSFIFKFAKAFLSIGTSIKVRPWIWYHGYKTRFSMLPKDAHNL